MSHVRRQPSAFSLVELLVVISILILVVGLTLPAITKSIESTRRNECATNQSKMALAMASFDTRKGVLPGIRNNLAIKSCSGKDGITLRLTPGGTILDGGYFPMPESTTNWFVMILPHLGHSTIFDAVVDGKVWMADEADWPVNNKDSLDITQCKSRGGFYDIAHVGKNMFYVANGAGVSNDPRKDTPDKFNKNDGAIGDNSNGQAVSLADIRAADGLSTTLLLAERDSNGATGLGKAWVPHTLSLASRLDSKPWPSNNGVPFSAVVGTFTTFGKDNSKRYAHTDTGGVVVFGLGTSTPSSTTRIINSGGSMYPSSLGRGGSAGHEGGANVAFVDGSTKFLREDLAPHVYGHLVTHRSVWGGAGYSPPNSVQANKWLMLAPSPPYVLKAEDY